MSADVFTLSPGRAPLLVSLPHVGTYIPEAMRERFVPRALAVEDTDWHLEALYAFARELGASLLVPRHSRYVIDLNRPPANTPMYPGVNNTELCPTRFFTGDPLYREGEAPDEAEIAARIERYWRPYHQALGAELARLKAQHGQVVLWDGHSIQSALPWLFEGRLPDLNLGTANGASCAPDLRARLMGVLEAQSEFTHVTDGRFKGGYITREYGRPDAGVHALQLEMCWSCYMAEAPPYEVEEARSRRLAPLLRRLLETAVHWRPHA
ncbi:MAG TPA: N-formylglutamate deformylase [Caldimonas sp.]|jgi:N-formylglutamate deformylase|nr:N-formylglutamate deformylase [Caldimonas sp.]HEX2542418.1 N-formylglutamate deformylase [Caldimonas sp.]